MKKKFAMMNSCPKSKLCQFNKIYTAGVMWLRFSYSPLAPLLRLGSEDTTP